MRMRGVLAILMMGLAHRPESGPRPAGPAEDVVRRAAPTSPRSGFDEHAYVADLDRRLADSQRLLLGWADEVATDPEAELEAVDAIGRSLLLIRRALLVAGCDAPTRKRDIATTAPSCLSLDGQALAQALELGGSGSIPGAEAARRTRALAAELGRVRVSLAAPVAADRTAEPSFRGTPGASVGYPRGS